MDLNQPTIEVDKYGSRHLGSPKRLRSARLVVDQDHFLHNDWLSIMRLVEDETPAAQSAAGAAVLRRYVAGWSTW